LERGLNNKGRKIGDRYIRIQRLEEFRVPIYLPKSRYLKQLLASNPVLVGVMGIAAAIILGGGLLMLPFSNTQGGMTPPLTAFFTSTSAVSTTGFALVTTATYWSLFGQMVICLLIFIGGIGLVAIVMFNLWVVRSRFTLSDRILTREALAADSFEGILPMLRKVIFIDLAITVVGAALLFTTFRNHYDVPTSVWQALFHSVSAFNTAGFDIVGPASFLPLRSDAMLLSVTTIEQILGAVGFAVLIEVPVVRRWRRFSLNTKLVLSMTLVIYLIAIFAMLANETLLGTSLNEFDIGGKIYSSIYNALSGATTTGFASIDFSQITRQSMLIMTGVMFVGGATGSTAGGIKVNTFSVIVASIWSTIRGKPHTEVFGREIESQQIWRALAITLSNISVLVIGVILILAFNQNILFEKILFEASSALATCGLSTGALLEFSVSSTIVVIFLMFIGRIAPLSVTSIFTMGRKAAERRYPQEQVNMG
jgi:trk system potassium uptake protein